MTKSKHKKSKSLPEKIKGWLFSKKEQSILKRNSRPFSQSILDHESVESAEEELKQWPLYSLDELIKLDELPTQDLELMLNSDECLEQLGCLRVDLRKMSQAEINVRKHKCSLMPHQFQALKAKSRSRTASITTI